MPDLDLQDTFFNLTFKSESLYLVFWGSVSLGEECRPPLWISEVKIPWTCKKIPWACKSGAFIVNFEHFSQLVVLFLLLTLSR